MKIRILGSLALLIFSGLLTAQTTVVKQKKRTSAQKKVMLPTDFGVVEQIQNIPKDVVVLRKKYALVPNKLRRNPYLIESSAQKKDNVVQTRQKRTLTVNVDQQWEGISEASQQVSPPDPSGAVGPSHYVQMVNTAMQIFDKTGNSLWGPTSLSSVFPGSANDGDPIVMYDKFADRWFISQFQTSGNKILIAISKTNNPLGDWYYYEYSFDEFPDYPKYSIWNNAYIMTSNTTVQNAAAFNREKMLLGDPSAEVVALTIPSLNTTNFISVLPGNAAGNTLPAKDTPVPLFYFNDDGWGTGKDQIRIWEMDVQWDTPNSSSISLKQELDVAPFNTDFDTDWNDIQQPNTSARLDAVPGAFMYMGHVRTFSDYENVALCQTVDVDLSNDIRGAIRWYELRKENGVWSVEQQSTFAPDNTNRWMGSIATDRQGNIGVAYSTSSSTIFPSLAFSGRKKDDSNGSFTVNENTVFNGASSQESTNRFGDYSQMTIDPVDDLTFWFTGEYMGSTGWKTGVFSFKIGEVYSKDLTVLDVVNPVNGSMAGSYNPKVLVKNIGSTTITSFDLSVDLNSNQISETFNSVLNPNDTVYVTFNQSFTFNSGQQNVSVFCALTGDEDLSNDTLNKSIFIKYNSDAGVQSFVSPSSAYGLGNEEVKVLVKNYGNQDISNIPVGLMLDGNLLVVDTITTIIKSDSIYQHTFSAQVNMSAVSAYNLIAFTNLVADEYQLNDTSKKMVENLNCNPLSDCEPVDYIAFFSLGTLQNTTQCSTNGYGDYTNLSTDLVAGSNYDVKIEVDEADHYMSLWIDFNDNLIFEDDERIMTDSMFNYVGDFILSIPANASIGNHLMRVRTHWDDSSSDPCATFDYGETEDYTVRVIGPDSAEEISKNNFYLTVVNENVQINFSKSTSDELNLSVINGLGQIVHSEIIPVGSNTFDFQANLFAQGVYYVKLNDEKTTISKPFVVR